MLYSIKVRNNQNRGYKLHFPKSSPIQRHFDELTSFFKDYRIINVVYLFGSHATKVETVLSDIDLAILVDDSIDSSNFLSTRLELIYEITRILHVDAVDVIILNQSSPLSSYEAICGDIIFCQDEEKRVDFETKTITRYLDFQLVYEEYEKGLLEDIKSW